MLSVGVIVPNLSDDERRSQGMRVRRAVLGDAHVDVDLVAGNGFLGLLTQLQTIRNTESNLMSLRRNLDEYQALADGGGVGQRRVGGHRGDTEAALGVGAVLQHIHRRVTAGVVRVLRVIGPGQQYFARAHVAAEVIHMAVGFVIEQAIWQPNDLVHRQLGTEHRLDFLAIQVRVAIVVEQALLGGDQSAFAIDMNRTAFEDKTLGAVARAALDFENLAGHQRVPVPWGIQPTLKAAPGIEVPIDTAHFAVVIDHERRACVPDPGVVAGHFHQADIRHIEPRPGVFVLGGGHRHGDRLVRPLGRPRQVALCSGVRANGGFAWSQCFWKKRSPRMPSGQRIIVSGRSARCGSSTGAMPGIVM